MNYTDLERLPGFIILVDFEKAFDSVEWPFLFRTLKSFNFGPSFFKWIEILYNKIESCVSNNGYFSKYFELSRGIRQGCPISSLLFILVAEVMAIKIRNDEKVCGIKFRNIEYKICQLADDTTIFVKDTDSIIQLLSVMKKFQNCSGLKINVEKTEVIPVGIYKFKNKALPKETRLGQLGANISPDRSSLTPQVLIGNFLKHNYPLLYELQHINLLCLYLPKEDGVSPDAEYITQIIFSIFL